MSSAGVSHRGAAHHVRGPSDGRVKDEQTGCHRGIAVGVAAPLRGAAAETEAAMVRPSRRRTLALPALAALLLVIAAAVAYPDRRGR